MADFRGSSNERNSDTDSGSDISTVSRTSAKKKHPPQFKVVLINDDYTSMDFVVSILETIFQKSPAEAVQVMLQVHRTGKGVCGIYSKQVAEAKIDLVQKRAKQAGFPLRCSMEEV